MWAMRLRAAAVVAMLVGTAIAGAGVMGVSAVSAATEPSVTVKAIDREGKPVAVSASLQLASAYAGFWSVNSGQAVKVPPGVYNIDGLVWEPGSKAATFVDKAVTVKSSGTVVLDARPGRRVRFTVDDPTVRQDGLDVEVDSPSTGQSTFSVPVAAPVVYLVPGALPAGWNLVLEADLIRPRSSLRAPSPEYNLIKTINGAVPANLTFSTRKASLARYHVTLKAIDLDRLDGVGLRPLRGPDGSWIDSDGFSQQAVVPFSTDFYLTPGYQWQAGTLDAQTQSPLTEPFLGGHEYSQTFNSAVFGPSPWVGPGVAGNGMYTNPSLGEGLLSDPVYPSLDSLGIRAATVQGWLYRGSKLLSHSTGYDNRVTTKISATPEWYTFRVQVNRAGSNHLSQAMTASLKFKTQANDTSFATFWPQMIPRGLSLLNSARRGTKTVVPITFDTQAGAIAVHGVKVWASTNGGKTWTAHAVGNSGSTWTVTIANPGKAGYVSLRVQGTNASGATALVTVINAYRVS
jgi:hypothetical protein